jgi:8-oxo-dGTP pyrophosphatase MutT (NUDIX family)
MRRFALERRSAECPLETHRDSIEAAGVTDLWHLLQRYHSRFPGEAHRHAVLAAQVRDGDTCFSRKNLRGHITTSAAVLNPEGTRILMVYHRFFQKWLPPGGHFEAPGSLWTSALREVAEETGVQEVAPHGWTDSLEGLPVDIDTHPIPPNPCKGEDAHLHHDVRFLAIADDAQVLLPQLDEVEAARWVSIDEMSASSDERVRALHAKLNGLGVLGAPWAVQGRIGTDSRR